MIFQVILIHFVFGLKPFQVRNDLVFVLLDLVFGVKVAFDLGKRLLGFWLNID
jgi:hypothetical protein